MRNSEIGLRNCGGGFEPLRPLPGSTTGRSIPTSAFRIPHFALILLLASCNPATTRPDFYPLPQAPRALLFARRERVIPILETLVTAESLRVKRASTVDGYLETDWYDLRTHRSYRDNGYVPDLAHTVKLRCWADPYVPSRTILTIEAVYRPRYDPSRVERELEAIVPLDREGHALVESLLKRARERFGSPKGAHSP